MKFLPLIFTISQIFRFSVAGNENLQIESSARSEVILPKCKDGDVAVFLFVGTKGVRPQQYSHLLESLQTELCRLNQRLWIVSPKFSLNIWLKQSTVEDAIDASMAVVVSSLLDHGIPDLRRVSLFLGGHSKGARAVQDFLANNLNHTDVIVEQKASSTGSSSSKNSLWKQFRLAGLVNIAQAVQRKYRADRRIGGNDLLPSDLPTFTVGGELDGIFRVFRLAESSFHDHRQQSKKDIGNWRWNILIPGANHFSFMAGHVPIIDSMKDLKAEVGPQSVQQSTARLLSAFIHTNARSSLTEGEKAKDRQLLLDQQTESDKFFQPILKSLKLEGSYRLMPPCSDLRKSGDARECVTGSPWSEQAQVQLAAVDRLKSVSKVQVRNEFWKSWLVYPFHHPKILNQCGGGGQSAEGQTGCKLEMETVSECWLSGGNGDVDGRSQPVSCFELQAKMNSRQASYQAGGVKNASFADLDDNNHLCQQINRNAIEWALKNAAEKTRARYRRAGVQLRAGEDLGPFNGGRWIIEYLRFERQSPVDKGRPGVMEVRSPSMRTPLNYTIPIFRGYHYCKLLSPAKALEWIYTDSLLSSFHFTNLHQ